MRSRTTSMGHAVHPMLIVFPLGLLSTAVAFDILHLITGREGFSIAAAYAIAAGIIGGVIAAVFGFADWRAVPGDTRAHRVGLWHGAGNAVVLVLFAISWLLRLGGDDWRPGVVALIFSFAGVVVAGVTGWLGGELVQQLGLGVHEDAGLDAPSSLGRAPAG